MCFYMCSRAAKTILRNYLAYREAICELFPNNASCAAMRATRALRRHAVPCVSAGHVRTCVYSIDAHATVVNKAECVGFAIEGRVPTA